MGIAVVFRSSRTMAKTVPTFVPAYLSRALAVKLQEVSDIIAQRLEENAAKQQYREELARSLRQSGINAGLFYPLPGANAFGAALLSPAEAGRPPLEIAGLAGGTGGC